MNIHRIRVVSLVALVCVLPAARSLAQSDTITAQRMSAHVDFLAADALEGRDSGYAGAVTAARYVASELERCGFKPLLDDWLVPFEMKGKLGPATGSITIGSMATHDLKDVTPLAFSGTADVSGKAALSGSDVEGKIAFLSGGDDRKESKTRAIDLAKKGAIGVVFVSAKADFGPPLDPRRMGGRAPHGDDAGGAILADLPGDEISIPVVRVARRVGGELLDLAESGADVKLSVAHDFSATTYNVCGVLEGNDPALKDEYVVMGAHFDHVGVDGTGNIWNGADDNASGTAAVCEVANALATAAAHGHHPKRSIVLCAWGAEERGLLGSYAFQKRAPLAWDKIAAYVNLDMISRNDPHSIDVLSASKGLFERTAELAKAHGLAIRPGQAQFIAASDSLPFVEKDVPTVFFFSGIHEQYHTPADDPGTIDADKAARVAQTAYDVLVDVADATTRPTFDPPAMASMGFTGSSRLLGITPNRDAPADGVKIDEVNPSGLAAKVGLEPGDVVVRVGKSDVKNVSDLRKALRAPAAGEEFEIEVHRGAAAKSVVVKGKFDE